MCDVHETPSFSTNSKVGPFLITHHSTSMYIILSYKLHVNLAVILSIAYDTVSMVTTNLVPRPERGRRKKACSPLFAHALSCGGIPPIPWTINLCLYTHDVETDTQHDMIGTPYHTGSTEHSICYKTLCSLKCPPAARHS